MIDSATGLIDAIAAASGGSLPDVVYLPVVGGPFEEFAQAISGTGARLLGSDQ